MKNLTPRTDHQAKPAGRMGERSMVVPYAFAVSLELEIQRLKSDRDNLRERNLHLMEDLCMSDDGSGPAWCAGCGGLMRAVRVGRHECFACERMDELQRQLTNNQGGNHEQK
jgi:hypothetical protein